MKYEELRELWRRAESLRNDLARIKMPLKERQALNYACIRLDLPFSEKENPILKEFWKKYVAEKEEGII